MNETPILTLEPLIEAIREGVEGAGWTLSGLQKTTSHQFEGRWEGESTRSAYLFFHHAAGPEWASLDVYLDETSRGLSGNLALVVDLLPIGDLDSTPELLDALAAVSRLFVGDGTRRPLTLRFRMSDAAAEVAAAETEVRFKVRLPRAAMASGPRRVRAFAARTVDAFGRIAASAVVREVADQDEADPDMHTG